MDAQPQRRYREEMRNVLALAVILAFSPARSEDIPEHTQAGLRALLTASLAANQCEDTQIDPDRFEEVAKSFGIEADEIFGRYKDFSDAFTADLLKGAQSEPEKFCALALKTFGPDGDLPGVLGTE